jgi:hypothetical protein
MFFCFFFFLGQDILTPLICSPSGVICVVNLKSVQNKTSLKMLVHSELTTETPSTIALHLCLMAVSGTAAE